MSRKRTVDEIIRDNREYVSKRAAMALLDVSEKTLRKRRQEGCFDCVLYGNTFWYSIDSINRFFKKHRVYYGNCITK